MSRHAAIKATLSIEGGASTACPRSALRFLPSLLDKQIDVLLGFGDRLEAQTDCLTLKVENALTSRVAYILPGPTIQPPRLRTRNE
jgi:hypothetical protein